jgi:hypothetical protein
MSTSFPPATDPIDRGLHRIPVAALHIAGAALDAGVFYQEEFVRHTSSAWAQAFPVFPKCITEQPDGRQYVDAIDADYPAQKAQFQALKELLRSERRGAWALLRRPWRDDPTRCSWSVALSAGDGEVVSPDLSGIVGQPTPEEFIARAVAYEVYIARDAETKRRAGLTSRALIRQRGWSVGATLRHVTLASKRYSTAKIIEICDEYVTLHLTLKGSRRRWEWRGLAQFVQHASYPPVSGRLELVVAAPQDAAA